MPSILATHPRITAALLCCLAAPTLMALLTGCSTPLPIDARYRAVSQDSRVQFIILHYTQIDFARWLHRLTQEEVSSHYLVNDDPPTIYRLVDESARAWHAGSS